MSRAHIRIDDGIKRGPRRKPGPKPGLPQRGGWHNAVLPTNQQERSKLLAGAVQRYSQGERLEDIANDLKVSREAIRAWMLDDCPEYKEVQKQGLLAKAAFADDLIQQAYEGRDMVALACAREMAKFARMDLERRRPDLYGQKQEVTHSVSPVLHIHTAQQHKPQVIDSVGVQTHMIEHAQE